MISAKIMPVKASISSWTGVVSCYIFVINCQHGMPEIKHDSQWSTDYGRRTTEQI
jgi:hypothetical protein